MKKKALISVSDKTGIIEFAQGLLERGFDIISTGGTYQYLVDANIPCLTIDTVTGFPEILDGRVKTLHPKIHGGLLAQRYNKQHQQQIEEQQIAPIDLVCVNLYPFAQTIAKENVDEAEIIENIDIGGPSMLRSAAKNYQDVIVICDYRDYEKVLLELDSGKVSDATRRALAIKVFNLTAQYDATIANYFNRHDKLIPDNLTLTYRLEDTLRYGENPHQQAWYYSHDYPELFALNEAEQLHGKAMSYNNIQDASAALDILAEFPDEIACVVVKHMNPCGVAVGESVEGAFDKAYEADPISIFGGIVAINGTIDETTAQKLHGIFLEIIIAYDYTPQALDILKRKKNLRLYKIAPLTDSTVNQVKSVRGGILIQETNNDLAQELQLVTDIASPQQADLLFALKIVKHVKSNAIVVAKDKQTLGIGAGQMNRVGACEIALKQAGKQAQGAVLASDAFFPMDDSVTLAADCGIAAIIQPGGSIRDQDSINKCNEKGVAMYMTHIRHFKH